VKKGLNIKNVDIFLFAYSRRVQKSLFHCSKPKGSWVMAVCLNHVETIIRNYFFHWFRLGYSKERRLKKNLPHHWILLFMANTMVQIATLYIIAFVSFVRACNLFSLYLLYKLIFLLLLLWRAVTLKLFDIWGWNFAKAYIWLCRLWILNNQES